MSKPLSLTKQGGKVFSSGQMARQVGVLQYHISALAKKDLIEFFLIDGNRYYDEADIPTIRAACIEAGYIQPPAKTPGDAYDDFNAFLASIELGSEQRPLTTNQREQLFELFRKGTEAKSQPIVNVVNATSVFANFGAVAK